MPFISPVRVACSHWNFRQTNLPTVCTQLGISLIPPHGENGPPCVPEAGGVDLPRAVRVRGRPCRTGRWVSLQSDFDTSEAVRLRGTPPSTQGPAAAWLWCRQPADRCTADDGRR